MIRHIWFDFSETIATINKEVHDKLRYEVYANVRNQPVTPELIKDYESLYEEHKHSNSAIFKYLGLPSDFWSLMISKIDPRIHYRLMDPNIPMVFEEISKIIPLSIFSNINLDRILPSLEINPKCFTHIISAGMAGKPKPALDGFQRMVQLSRLLPEEILYIGDHREKDVLPAKSLGIRAGTVFEKIPEADYFFKDFKDILEFVKERNK